MTVLELKAKIKKAIDSLPECRLQELLDHINRIIKKAAEKRSTDQFFERVAKEDDNLLKRLSD